MYFPYEKLNEIKKSNYELSFFYNDKNLKLKSVSTTDEEIFKIACWREKYFDAFPGKFYVTYSGTKTWLQKQVLDNEDRFLFMIFDDNEILGHLGFFRFNQENNSCEIDNVVKGTEGYKGLMTKALNLVCSFAFDELKLNYLTLRVFDDNEKAKKLYERCDFKQKKLIPLKKKYNNDIFYDWIETEENSAERYFCEMILEK